MNKKKIESLNDVKPGVFYKADELAELFCVTERTIRKYCIEGAFPNAVKILGGKRWLIPGEDVAAVLTEGYRR